MEMLAKKREREPNYASKEVDLLLELCNKFSRVIENKETNAISWKEKAKVWDEIHILFNSSTDGQPRTIKSLRQKYDALKKEVRKTIAKQRRNVTDTGGGPYREEKLSPSLEQLHNTIKISCDGLNSPFDSDNVTTINNLNNESLENQILEEEVDDPEPCGPSVSPPRIIQVDFDSFSAPMLQTTKPSELRYKNQQSSTKSDNLEKTPNSSSIPSSSKRTNESRVVHRKKKTVSSLVSNYDNLCQEKAAFFIKEKELAEKRSLQEDIEHKLRVKKLKLETEKLELEIKVLRRELL